MKLVHIAIWTNQLEVLKDFYERFFAGKAGELYEDITENIICCYVYFPEGSKLELLQAPHIRERAYKKTDRTKGFTHLAFDAGSKEKVDAITVEIEKAGYEIEKPARMITEWFYESAVLDPDGNIIEINSNLGVRLKE